MVGSLSGRIERAVHGAGDFLASGRFALFVMTFVVCWTVALLAILLWPEDFSPIASFAASFKVWCFGYDPLTGAIDRTKVALVLLDPLFMGIVIGAVWRQMLPDALRRRPASVVGYGLFSCAVIGAILGSLARQDAAAGTIADYRLERTRDLAPAVSLTDTNGALYSLVPGRVTVVTAFYAHCAHTCPQLIRQARRALQGAGFDGAQVDVVLITLDPERDTVSALRDKAAGLSLGANWHLLTGEAGKVNRVLDLYGVARARDANGNIGHSSLFYVIDRMGWLAFRISLGTAQEVWLRKALQTLVDERP